MILCAAVFAQEIDVTRLQKIGDAISFVRHEAGITINCRDNSQVQLAVLAPYLIRVRAASTKAIPHSLIPDALHHAFATFGVLMSPDLPLTRRQHEMITTVVSVTNRCHY